MIFPVAVLTMSFRDLWREDAKLETTVGHARDELRTAERTLATMMDKVRRKSC
jgi:structural maintenance of chromosome 3 (chondroitin sulfate proteoglycan 6)